MSLWRFGLLRAWTRSFHCDLCDIVFDASSPYFLRNEENISNNDEAGLFTLFIRRPFGMSDEATLSDLDKALLANGFTQAALTPHTGYDRSDSPPECCHVRLADPITGPEAIEPVSRFPQKPESKDTLQHWEIECLRRLIALYGEEKEQLETVISKCCKPTPQSSSFDSRINFFETQLQAILDAPLSCDWGGFMSLLKLWRNKQFELSKRDSAQPERCCDVLECQNVAMHGSRFCIWHITKDELQTFFANCDDCGWPKLKRDNPEEEVHNCT